MRRAGSAGLLSIGLLQALLPTLLATTANAQDFSKIQIEKVVAGLKFSEGPAWSREGFLIFADVPGNHLWKLVPGEKAVVFREDSEGAIGDAYDAQGRLYTCESRSRRVTRTDKKGQVEVLADRWEGKRFNAPNDIIVRRDGNVYFTDPAFGSQADTRELDFYGIYRITPKGVLSVVAKPTGRPNGIALAPNGRVLYVANSDEHNIRAYDLDRGGEPSGERIVISDIEGVPDGIRTDEKGNLYVAAKGIAVYNSSGKSIAHFDLGETPSNCAFGDPDLQTLYITARSSLYRVRLDVKGAVQY